MSDRPESARVPRMAADDAQEIARGLKWLGQSYARVGMARDATRMERDSAWWLTYSLSLSQTPPKE